MANANLHTDGQLGDFIGRPLLSLKVEPSFSVSFANLTIANPMKKMELKSLNDSISYTEDIDPNLAYDRIFHFWINDINFPERKFGPYYVPYIDKFTANSGNKNYTVKPLREVMNPRLVKLSDNLYTLFFFSNFSKPVSEYSDKPLELVRNVEFSTNYPDEIKSGRKPTDDPPPLPLDNTYNYYPTGSANYIGSPRTALVSCLLRVGPMEITNIYEDKDTSSTSATSSSAPPSPSPSSDTVNRMYVICEKPTIVEWLDYSFTQDTYPSFLVNRAQSVNWTPVEDLDIPSVETIPSLEVPEHHLINAVEAKMYPGNIGFDFDTVEINRVFKDSLNYILELERVGKFDPHPPEYALYYDNFRPDVSEIKILGMSWRIERKPAIEISKRIWNHSSSSSYDYSDVTKEMYPYGNSSSSASKTDTQFVIFSIKYAVTDPTPCPSSSSGLYCYDILKYRECPSCTSSSSSIWCQYEMELWLGSVGADDCYTGGSSITPVCDGPNIMGSCTTETPSSFDPVWTEHSNYIHVELWKSHDDPPDCSEEGFRGLLDEGDDLCVDFVGLYECDTGDFDKDGCDQILAEDFYFDSGTTDLDWSWDHTGDNCEFYRQLYATDYHTIPSLPSSIEIADGCPGCISSSSVSPPSSSSSTSESGDLFVNNIISRGIIAPKSDRPFEIVDPSNSYKLGFLNKTTYVPLEKLNLFSESSNIKFEENLGTYEGLDIEYNLGWDRTLHFWLMDGSTVKKIKGPFYVPYIDEYNANGDEIIYKLRPLREVINPRFQKIDSGVFIMYFFSNFTTDELPNGRYTDDPRYLKRMSEVATNKPQKIAGFTQESSSQTSNSSSSSGESVPPYDNTRNWYVENAPEIENPKCALCSCIVRVGAYEIEMDSDSSSSSSSKKRSKIIFPICERPVIVNWIGEKYTTDYTQSALINRVQRVDWSPDKLMSDKLDDEAVNDDFPRQMEYYDVIQSIEGKMYPGYTGLNMKTRPIVDIYSDSLYHAFVTKDDSGDDKYFRNVDLGSVFANPRNIIEWEWENSAYPCQRNTPGLNVEDDPTENTPNSKTLTHYVIMRLKTSSSSATSSSSCDCPEPPKDYCDKD